MLNANKQTVLFELAYIDTACWVVFRRIKTRTAVYRKEIVLMCNEVAQEIHRRAQVGDIVSIEGGINVHIMKNMMPQT